MSIHYWKDLSLRIVRRPEKIIFIVGPVYKPHIKCLAFTAHFPFKVLDFFKGFQRAQHQWNNTLKLQCSHLNFARILQCKTLSKYGAHSKIQPGTNFLHILLWKNVARQNGRKLLMHLEASFKLRCMLNPIGTIKTPNFAAFLIK